MEFLDIKPCVHEKSERVLLNRGLLSCKYLSLEVNACKEHSNNGDVILIHISTDFVFDGKKNTPYIEDDRPNPLGVYGKTKLDGEKRIRTILEKHIIIRTSWLYSEFGNNFLKTMLSLAKNRNEINVIDDQIGTPTYAKDLAEIIFIFITAKIKKYGIYHYSNEGVASWYDFTKAIFELKKIKTLVKPILTIEYPTPAERPKYSVLNKRKLKKDLNLTIPYWRDSLAKCIIKNSNSEI